MIKLVVDNGERAALGSGRGNVARPARSPKFMGSANGDCSVELIGLTVATLMHSLLRCGAVRGEQHETALSDLADEYERIVQCAPAEVLEGEQFDDFAQRLEAAAVMLRERVIEISLGDHFK